MLYSTGPSAVSITRLFACNRSYVSCLQRAYPLTKLATATEVRARGTTARIAFLFITHLSSIYSLILILLKLRETAEKVGARAVFQNWIFVVFRKMAKNLLTRRKHSGIISMRLRETQAHQMRKHWTELEQLKSGK